MKTIVREYRSGNFLGSFALWCAGALGVCGTLAAAPEEVSLVIRPIVNVTVNAPRFGDSLAMQGTIVASGDMFWSSFEEGLQASSGRIGAIHLYDISNPLAPVRRSFFSGADSQDIGEFGASVAISGDLLIVGAPQQEFIGAAYLFDISDPKNPEELAKIVALDRASGSDFGISVDIDGDLVLIGAPSQNAVPGAAYLFDISDPGTPVEIEKLTAQMPANSDRFGRSVSLHTETDRALIGVPSQAGVAGFAELYDISSPGSPVFLAMVNATADESVSNNFGFSVDLSATAALVGAPGRDDMGVGNDTGAAYLFDLANPSSPSGVQILASDRGARHQLGYVLEMSGIHAVVGATGTNSGLDGVFGYFFNISNLASPVQGGKLLPGQLRLFNGAMGIATDKNFAVLAPVNDTENSATPAASLFKLFDASVDLFPEEPVTGIPAMALPEDFFPVMFSVSNSGNVSSDSFLAGVYLSSDDTITTRDSRVGFVELDTLEPGSTDEVSVSVTIPASFRLGNYHVGVFADSSRSVAEADETNNTWVSMDLLLVGTAEAILKQGEVDVVDRSIGDLNRRIRREKKKLVKAKKKRDRRLLRRGKRNIRKFNSQKRGLLATRVVLVNEMKLLLEP